MTNAELIKAIRENEECNNCAIWKHGECNERKMSLSAADALEAADKRIAELEKSYSWKAYAALEESIEGYKTRIAELDEEIIYWQTYAAEIER